MKRDGIDKGFVEEAGEMGFDPSESRSIITLALAGALELVEYKTGMGSPLAGNVEGS